MKYCFASILLLGSTTATAAEFSTRVIDPFGAPIAGVDIALFVFIRDEQGHVDTKTLAEFRTDRQGRVRGAFDETHIADQQKPMVKLHKDGYEGYDSGGFQPEFVLHRKLTRDALGKVAALRGQAQIAALREVLSAEMDDDGQALSEMVLHDPGRLRPPLLALAAMKGSRDEAVALLAQPAFPQDMARLLARLPEPGADFHANRWIYALVTGLIEPTTQNEWELLRRAANGTYKDGWVDYGAILTLRLSATPRSRTILAAAARENARRVDEIADAIAYIDHGAKAVAHADLVQAGELAAGATGIGEWQGNESPRIGGAGTIAQIDCRFVIGRDLLVYTATFHRVGGTWRLRAMRETRQALLALPTDK